MRLCGKTAKGVRIVNIDPPDTVVGIDRIVNEETASVVATDQQPEPQTDAGSDPSAAVAEDQTEGNEE